MIKKKIAKLGMILGIVALMLGPVSVSADPHVAYWFNLGNTGQKFNVDRDSLNMKMYAGQSWTFKPYHLSTGSSPYGMRFIPYHAGGSICSGCGIWRKTGQYDKVYVNFSGWGEGFYYLAARCDDTATTNYSSDGWWNADIVSN